MGTKDTKTLRRYVVEGCLQFDKDQFITTLRDWEVIRGEGLGRPDDGFGSSPTEARCSSEEGRTAFVQSLDNEALIEFYEATIRYDETRIHCGW